MKIHQSLHGYSGGHHLLKASARLATDSERLMLVLSDLSGPSVRARFESYLTGYPISSEIYCLARTWLASEMPRPGCVWTHSLLLPSDWIVEARDLTGLLRLFRRPTAAEDPEFSWYAKAIETSELTLNGASGNDSSFADLDQARAGELITALYKAPLKPVIVITEDFERYELEIMAIWEQQWPSLRQSFAFCTTSLGLRTLKRKPFDVQLVPKTFVPNDIAAAHILNWDMRHMPSASGIPEWAAEGANDICSGATTLRRFLWEFGNDTWQGRVAYAPLIEVCFLLRSKVHGNAKDLVRLIGGSFARKDDAKRLKQYLFDDSSLEPGWLERPAWLGELGVLRELLVSPYEQAFDATAVAIEDRVEKLWKSQRDAMKELAIELSDKPLTELKGAFFRAMAAAISYEDAEDVLSLPGSSISRLVHTAPIIARHQWFWRESTSRQIVWNAIQTNASERRTSGPTSDDREPNGLEFIAGMLSAECDEFAEDVMELFGDVAVFALLDWVQKTSAVKKHVDVGAGWQRALVGRRSCSLRWLNENVVHVTAGAAAFIAQAFAPRHGIEISDPDLMAIQAIKRGEGHFDRDAYIEVLALLLALGLRDTRSKGNELVVKAFSSVHSAAAQDRLSSDAWSLLEPHVPLLWSRNWDKCERLREALVDTVVRFSWPPNTFLACAGDDETLENILSYCKDTRNGRSLIETLNRDIVAGQTQATESQKRIVAQRAKRPKPFGFW